MPQDRVSGLLAAYFTQPYAEYGEVALEESDKGGLSFQRSDLRGLGLSQGQWRIGIRAGSSDRMSLAALIRQCQTSIAPTQAR